MGMRQRFTVKELLPSKAPDRAARTILVEFPAREVDRKPPLPGIHFPEREAPTMSMNAHRAPIVAVAIVIGTTLLTTAQSPIQSCGVKPQPAWCSAVEGDRSEGWLS